MPTARPVILIMEKDLFLRRARNPGLKKLAIMAYRWFGLMLFGCVWNTKTVVYYKGVKISKINFKQQCNCSFVKQECTVLKLLFAS
jgi:hypothetical protein